MESNVQTTQGGEPGRRTAWIGRWSPASIRGRLVLLTMVLMAPALIVGGAFLWDAAKRERQAVETQLGETARALSLGLDRQIGQDRELLAALATSPLLRIGNYSAFDAQARQAAPPGVWIVVQAPDGQNLVNTGMSRGAVLPKTPSSPATLWSSESQGVRVSNVFLGPTGRPQIVVRRDTTGGGGAPLEIATVRLATSLGSILEAQQLPASWIGTLVDARGTVVARSLAPDRFVGGPATPDIVQRLARSSEGVAEAVLLDGRPGLMAHAKAPESNWAVLVAMPLAELMATTRGALSWAAFIGFALLASGLLLAAWVAEGVVRPIEALAAYAGALGGGASKPPPPTHLREAGLVGDALTRSAKALGEREEELRRFNATLESRITERTRELEDATESLIQSQKLEAIGRLTGGIAHDFNNLLTAVQGNLELLARRVTDDKLSVYISRARQAAERGAKLTAQLLAFSRRQRLEPEPIDINNSVQNASTLLQSTLGGALRVELVLKSDLWPAIADATQLELIILNLAINARDAMPTGGLIIIHTENIHLTKPPERPEAPAPGDYVVISVSDTGEGMTPEVLARVFEPFFTTKEVGKGSGLGLPQVLGVTKQLGGGVEISSRSGEGATVKVYMPRAATQAAVRDLVSPEEIAAEVVGTRIMLVDDDPDVRGVAVSMLDELGCRVRHAATGQAALDALQSDPAVDVVILDYAMPGLNGAQTAAVIRERWPDMSVLLMSGYADSATLSEAWSGPFLHKPFSGAGLAAQLSKLLRGRNVVQLRPSGT